MKNARLIILILFLFSISGANIHAQRFFSVRKLPFNSNTTQEMAPSFYKNGIVFCTDRRNKILFRSTDLLNYNNTNLYWSEQKKPGKFANPQEFARELSTQYHEGSASFSKDGKTVYFTRSIDVTKKVGNSLRGDTALGIFSADNINGQWTNIQPFPYSRLNINTAYPCLSDDGRQLFFCSTDTRGFGNYDIYVSEIVNGQPRNPENLGSKINTPENDVFPFLHKTGRLYFASRGHGSGRDLNIYYSEQVNGEWQDPVALPDPFNTNSDDFGLIFNETSDTAYFSSTRGNSMDIYMAFSTLPVFADCGEQQENDYCYTFFEAREMNLDTTLFNYEWEMGDGTRVRGLKADHCYATTGNYTVQLNVIDLVTGEVYFNEATYALAVEDIIQPYIVMADTAFVGTEIQLNGLKSNLNFPIAGYYWDFGDASRAENQVVQHNYRRPGIYNIQLGVTGTVTDVNTFPEKACVTRKITVLNRNR